MNRTIFCLLLGVLSLPFAQGADELVIKPKSNETENTLARWEGIFHVYATGTAKDAEPKVSVDCPSGKPLTYYPWVKGKPYEVIKKENVAFDLKPDELKKTYTISAEGSWGSAEFKDSAQITVSNATPKLSVSWFKEDCGWVKKANPAERNYKANDKMPFPSCTIGTLKFLDIEKGKPVGLPNELPATYYVVDSTGKAEDVTHKKPFLLIFKPEYRWRNDSYYIEFKYNDYDSKYFTGEYMFRVSFSLKPLMEITDEAKQKVKVENDFPKELTVNIIPDAYSSRILKENAAKNNSSKGRRR